MPKKVFWPATLIIMGIIFLASNLGIMPKQFWNLWPLVLIIVGLGGLLTSDRDEWLSTPSTVKKASKSKKATSRKKKK